MKLKKRVSLGKRISRTIIILAIITAASIMSYTFSHYKESMEKLYNEAGYNYGDIILNNIDGDQVQKYAKTWKTDDDYAAFSDFLTKSWEGSKTLYVYIVIPNEDGTEMRYIYDSSGMDFGSTDPVNEKGRQALLNAYNNGERSEDYLVRRHPKYGYMTSSVLPVFNSKNEVVAVLFVDTNMTIIDQTLMTYIAVTLAISFVILALFLMIFIIYVRRTMVNPLRKIREETVTFTQAEPGELKVGDVLDRIKTHDEIEDTALAIHAMEEAIIQYMYNLESVTKEKERIGAELNVATKIQSDMLPKIFPAFDDIPQADLYATMNPAKEVGGDFYDYFKIDDNHIGLVMADVSGKGVPAALFMVISKTLVKNYTMSMPGAKPSEILAKVNDLLCEGNEAGYFCTCWLGIFNTETGHMVCTSAGHEYPALRDSNGVWTLFKDPHGLALAAMEGVRYKDYEISLNPGEAIYVYTDGVAEATDANNELYGTDRMIAALNADPMADPVTILKDIKKDIDKFVGSAPQFDDITMLCLHFDK